MSASFRKTTLNRILFSIETETNVEARLVPSEKKRLEPILHSDGQSKKDSPVGIKAKKKASDSDSLSKSDRYSSQKCTEGERACTCSFVNLP